MALSDDEQETVTRLKKRLDSDLRGVRGPADRRVLGFRVLDTYYNGIQHLEQLGLAVPDDLRDFVTIVGWPGTHVDSIEERLDIDGFALAGSGDADDEFTRIWQANDLDDESQLAHVDSLVYRRGYTCVGTNEDDENTPLVTVESPMEITHEWSNRERRVTSAARFYTETRAGLREFRATLYLPNATIPLHRARGVWVEDELGRDEHNIGQVPVEPLVNRQRTGDRYGRTEMGRILSLTDAAARALTNAQVATEVVAIPQRFAAGMTQADFKDSETGEQLTQWEAYFGAVWATANKDAKFGQFNAADLGNFTKIVEHYAKLVSGLTGLPMRYLGQLSDNPPSADGIRADESRLVKTCERKQRGLGASWERTMRIVRLFQTGEVDPSLVSLETLWRDPSTPTRAQAADAVVKLYNSDRPVITKRQARRDLGYTPEQIRQMVNDEADEAANAAANDPVTRQLLKDAGITL
ncbi:MAG: hypothetical protein JWO46_1714 [Nocardioidaceae bacterium]|nr:hypothetical protein [Nocardioidaceae bacterium]